MKTLLPVLLICLAAVLSVNMATATLEAAGKAPDNAKEPARTNRDRASMDPNDPNDLWWKKWDIPVKNPNDANELLRAKWDAVARVLQNKDLDQKTKEKIIDKVVSPIFDFPVMAMLALREIRWAKLTPPQREKFTSLFTERLKASYREKITLYQDEKVLFKPAVPGKTGISIPMELTSGGKNTAIIYRLRKADPQKAGWKIYDVEIQGVRIILTYRAEFDDILQHGTVEDLLARLAEPPTT
jgi:phospholipid transport system substrate-binding protein